MDDSDRDDAAQWDVVEEASEMMLEGDYHEALTRLRDIIKSDPSNPYAFFYTGTALFEIGQFEAAAHAYRAAIKISPRYTGARVGLSHCLRIDDDPRAAVAEARRALEIAPGDGDALFALGLAQAALGDNVSARRSLEAFLNTGPEFEASTEARAILERMTAPASDNDNDNDDIN
jgi:Flp pilus assembly protein TadD